MGILDNAMASSETQLDSVVKTATIGQEGSGLLATEGAIIASGESLEQLNMQTIGKGGGYAETGGTVLSKRSELIESGGSRADIKAMKDSNVSYNILDQGSIEQAFAFASMVHSDYSENVDDVLQSSLGLGEVVRDVYSEVYESARFDKIGSGQWSQYMPVLFGLGAFGLIFLMRKK